MTKPLRPDLFDPACPSSALPFRIGDKWTALVIRCLEDGPRRFTELRVPMARVTPKVLTETLRAMERDGMLTRTHYPEIPPRVEYELTGLGRSLLGLLESCCTWADEHLPEVLAARAEHETRTG
ncbi:winged helix-turn-helix transcriptional regulator [Crossiella cryophila]|uniref:DNA-binding HxlR family transcriptional regulator n=1 Tax=Crossiella cryophila TaxID=43355 RepID=A0A7W7FUI0_9PSEU|nr:helix-turn-helix domain-containing protein [Crossiella cryophila]MBB4679326.1 DNA-binding HxlR family transcriptional regulator [Crossiella cryophila]